MENLTAIPAGMIETQDEAQEIEREGQNPEKRQGDDFLAKLVGGGQEQSGGAGGEKKPQKIREGRNFAVGCMRGFACR
jgi:hypothetical protein